MINEADNYNVVEKAAMFAVNAHRGMTRKVNHEPFILHPMEVAANVASMSNDQEVIAAALLHDVVEDTSCTLEDILQNFGPRVTELVGAETEDKRPEMSPEQSWKLRKREAIDSLDHASLDAKKLFVADKLSNLRSLHRSWIKYGDMVFESFHMKDPAEQHWYYRSVADKTKELSDQAAWMEMDMLIQIIFEGRTE